MSFITRAVAPLLIGAILSACGESAPEPPPLRPADISPPHSRGELQGQTLIDTLDKVAASAARKDELGKKELISFARHPDYLVRVQAVKALSDESYRNDEAAKHSLVTALDDDFWLVRSFAVRALAKANTPESKAALTRRLQTEQHERVVYYIQRALEGKGGVENLPNDGF